MVVYVGASGKCIHSATKSKAWHLKALTFREKVGLRAPCCGLGAFRV